MTDATSSSIPAAGATRPSRSNATRAQTPAAVEPTKPSWNAQNRFV
jgi:hypothetical protein